MLGEHDEIDANNEFFAKHEIVCILQLCDQQFQLVLVSPFWQIISVQIFASCWGKKYAARTDVQRSR